MSELRERLIGERWVVAILWVVFLGCVLATGAGLVKGVTHAVDTTHFHQVPLGSWTLAWMGGVIGAVLLGSMPMGLAIIGVFAAWVVLDWLNAF
jgi:hypothetical protein